MAQLDLFHRFLVDRLDPCIQLRLYLLRYLEYLVVRLLLLALLYLLDLFYLFDLLYQ